MSEVVLLDMEFRPSLGLKVLEQSLKAQGVSCEIIGFYQEVLKGMRFDIKRNEYSVIDIRKSEEAVKEKLRSLAPQLSGTRFVGIQFMEDRDQIKLKVPVSAFLKRKFPNITLIGGGAGINTDPKRFFSAAKLDFAIRGEGDKALPALIRALKTGNETALERIGGLVRRKSGRIIVAEKPAMLSRRQVARLPFVSVNAGKDRAITYSTKGCPNACIFCSVSRKGKLVALSDKTIIDGLQELAKNKEIVEVYFVDDQFFSNRQRATRLLKKVIGSGLSQRFKFCGLATVDSFLRNGSIDNELIKLAKRARFVHLSVGTESLSDNTLHELKGGRYSSVQAIKINDALRNSGIRVRNFMLAGATKTTSRDFLESYYRAAAKNIRGSGDYGPLTMLVARRGTPLYYMAVQEGLVFSERGRKVNAVNDRKPVARYALPKDENLQAFFREKLRGRVPQVDMLHLPEVIFFGRALEQAGLQDRGTYRRFLKIYGQRKAKVDERKQIGTILFALMVKKECDQMGLPWNEKSIHKVAADKELMDRFEAESKIQSVQFQKSVETAEKFRGTNRLRQIKIIRKKFGISPSSRRAIVRL